MMETQCTRSSLGLAHAYRHVPAYTTSSHWGPRVGRHTTMPKLDQQKQVTSPDMQDMIALLHSGVQMLVHEERDEACKVNDILRTGQAVFCSMVYVAWQI